MKKLFCFTLLSIVLLHISCKKKEADNNGCENPSFTVNGGTNTVPPTTIQINSYSHGFLELEYGSNGFTKGTGTTITISNNYHELTGLDAGTYDVYLRGNCGGNSWSDWAGPKSFLVQQGEATCPKPTDLSASSLVWLEWEYLYSSSPDNFEVEYGTSGFTLGTGTRATTTNSSFSKGVFAQGTSYDFYVRMNCGNNDTSAWAGPHTFTAVANRNMCLNPQQVNVYSVYNGLSQCVGAQFEWDSNGESEWEVSLVSNGNAPGSGNITTTQSTGITYAPIACWGYYDFYIRTVCLNGTKTAWKGPTEF